MGRGGRWSLGWFFVAVGGRIVCSCGAHATLQSYRQLQFCVLAADLPMLCEGGAVS